MREWFKPLKRVDRTAGATPRPPPFHVDSLKAILQAASQGRLKAHPPPQPQFQSQPAARDPHLQPQAYSQTAAVAPRGPQLAARGLGRDRAAPGFDPRLSLDGGLARLGLMARVGVDSSRGGASAEEKGGLAASSSSSAAVAATSLLRTLQEVADDDASYAAHYPSSARSTRGGGASRAAAPEEDPNTPAEESKASSHMGQGQGRGQPPQLTDTGHLAAGVTTQVRPSPFISPPATLPYFLIASVSV
jgi:hypothetical protein